MTPRSAHPIPGYETLLRAEIEMLVDWLRGLAVRGGKGVVGNIDARGLGRCANLIEALRVQGALHKHSADDYEAAFDEANARREAAETSLTKARGLLAQLVEPDAIRSTSSQHLWAAIVAFLSALPPIDEKPEAQDV